MTKVDVVYTVGQSSKHGDDWELRHSLRSLEQQDCIGKIYIIGHKPSWAKEVIHIPCADPFPDKMKDANIIYKILLACGREELSENFVVNSDDHYILRPVTISDLEPELEFPSSLLSSHLKAAVSYWHQRLLNTIEYCARKGRPQYVFQGHKPYLVNKNTYKKIMTPLPWAQGIGLLTHVYYNFALVDTPRTEVGNTVRINTEITLDLLAAELGGKRTLFFNHNDDGLCPPVKKFIETLFSKKSRWEND